MDLDQLLARVRSALAMPTTYWLDFGGWGRGETPRERPGTAISVADELERLRVSPDPRRRAVREAYLRGAAEAGIDIAAMPAEACDCTNFLCWALGVARDSGPWPAHGGRINTTNIVDDAFGAQRLFVPLAQPRPGAVLVFKAHGGKVGHAGIVTEAGSDATRVVHCAPDHYALTPAAGQPRNAIAETGPDRFDAVPAGRLKIVWWKAFGP